MAQSSGAELLGPIDIHCTDVLTQPPSFKCPQVYISNSDLSPELQILISTASLTFQLGCLKGISDLAQDQIPDVLPKLISSTIFLISVKGNSITPVAQTKPWHHP